MISSCKSVSGSADSLASHSSLASPSHSSSKRHRSNTQVAFYALPPDMVDALHLLHTMCASCTGGDAVQVNELGIYNAFGLIDIISERLQSSPRTDGYLGE